ncbi:hypothetical protein A2U01_0064406, partial [Trifolium medium]|nr:hypothetical protein [Trifolium medium]
STTDKFTEKKDQTDGAQNEEHKEKSLPDAPPSSEISPESPFAAKESSMKNVTEDAPTSNTKEDLGTEKQIMDNNTQDVVTSATEESSKKDDADNVPTSKENATTETQPLEEDP